MARRIETTIRFDPKASRAKHAIALIYDLEGFSRFFNQPDVQDYVPRFLNHISNVFQTILLGGVAYWLTTEEQPDEPMTRLSAPIHEKFLGDGALYVLTPPGAVGSFTDDFVIHLCNRLWNLQNYFEVVLRRAADEVPVFELPKRIRFGLARGTVYELTCRRTARKEYIGFCINLASRLQKYCPELGFIASARVGLPEEILKKHAYRKVVATQIRGFPKEIVIVDKDEFEELDLDTRETLFEVPWESDGEGD